MRAHTMVLSVALLAGCSAVLDIKDKDYQPAAGAGGVGGGGAAGQGAGQGGTGALSGQGGGGQGGGGQGGTSEGGAGLGGAGTGGAGEGGAGEGGAGQGGAMGGAAGMAAIGPRPPGPPTADSTPDTTAKQIAFAVRKFHFGQNDPATGDNLPTAWRSIGFDVDGVTTTKELAASPSPGTCLRDPMAKTNVLTDGDEGRDNSFASNIFPSFNGFGNGKIETDLNHGIEVGSSPTMIIQIDNLNDGPDDTGVSAAFFFNVVEHPTKPPLWDGTDDFAIDSQSLNKNALSTPKVILPTGYLKGNTYVSGVFNDTSQPHTLFIPLGNLGFVGLNFISLTAVIELDEAHQQATRATVSGVVLPQDLEELFKKLLVTQFGCEGAKPFAGLYATLYQLCDLRTGEVDFLDKTGTKSCDAVSFAFDMELTRIALPNRVLDGPVINNTCDGGSGGGAGSP